MTKLSNAWLAGVPAIVGPEPAYLQLRRDELDMCLATDARGVLAALSRLVRNRAHTRRCASARAFGRPSSTLPAIRTRWLDFFRERVAPAFAQWQARHASPLTRYPWYFGQLLAERVAAKRFRAQARTERRRWAATHRRPQRRWRASTSRLRPRSAPLR